MASKKITLLFLWILWLLAGCGGSGSGGGTAGDPLAGPSAPPAEQGNITQPPAGPGAVVNYTLTLTALGSSGTATVGSNSTVTATAVLKDSGARMIANQPVRFEEVKADAADPALVQIPVPVVTTSSEGVATTFIQTVDTSVNRDVILKASTTIDGKVISSVAIIRIVRSTGNYINFISSKDITDPDGNLNTLAGTLENADPLTDPGVFFPQLVTFEVLDKNGVNRTSVDVTLEVFKVIGPCDVAIGGHSSLTETIATDDTGLGIFSARIIIQTPPPGERSTCSVIFKATTPDIYAATPRELFSYAGYLVTVKNERL